MLAATPFSSARKRCASAALLRTARVSIPYRLPNGNVAISEVILYYRHFRIYDAHVMQRKT